MNHAEHDERLDMDCPECMADAEREARYWRAEFAYRPATHAPTVVPELRDVDFLRDEAEVSENEKRALWGDR